MKKKRAPRRPRTFILNSVNGDISKIYSGKLYLYGSQKYYSIEQARKLASWLLKAAEYLEYKGREK